MQYLKVSKYFVQYLVFKYYLNTTKCEVFHKVFKYSGQSICPNTAEMTLSLRGQNTEMEMLQETADWCEILQFAKHYLKFNDANCEA